MSCPKCKAKIGIMKQEIVLASGIVPCTRCLICGFLTQPYQPQIRKQSVR
jgi:predicted Zn finger-like uncharacterized protein